MNNNRDPLSMPFKSIARSLHQNLNDLQLARDNYERRRCIRSLERVVGTLANDFSNLATREPLMNRDSNLASGVPLPASDQYAIHQVQILHPEYDSCQSIISDLVAILLLPVEIMADPSVIQLLESTVWILKHFTHLPLSPDLLHCILDTIGNLCVKKLQHPQSQWDENVLSAVSAVVVASLTSQTQQEDGIPIQSFGDTISLAEKLIKFILLYLPSMRWKPLTDLSGNEEQEKATLFDMRILLNFLFAHAANMSEDGNVNNDELQFLFNANNCIQRFITESIEYIVDAIHQLKPVFQQLQGLPEDDANKKFMVEELAIFFEDVIRNTGIVVHLIETLTSIQIFDNTTRVSSFYRNIFQFMLGISSVISTNIENEKNILQTMIVDLEERLIRLVSKIPDDIDPLCKSIAFLYSVSKTGLDFDGDRMSILDALILPNDTSSVEKGEDFNLSSDDFVQYPAYDNEGINVAQAVIMSSILYGSTLRDPSRDENVNAIVEKLQTVKISTRHNPWACIVSKRLIQSGIYKEEERKDLSI